MQGYVDSKMQFSGETLCACPCGISASEGGPELLNAASPSEHIGNWQFKSSYDAVCPNNFYLHLKQYRTVK